MKRIIFILPLIFLFVSISVQDINPGNDFFYYKRYFSAENFFHDYLKNQPASGEGWAWLVRSYAEQEKIQAISDTLEKAPLAIQQDPYLLAAKGIQRLLEKSGTDARMSFYQAIDLTKGKNLDIILLVANSQL